MYKKIKKIKTKKKKISKINLCVQRQRDTRKERKKIKENFYSRFISLNFKITKSWGVLFQENVVW